MISSLRSSSSWTPTEAYPSSSYLQIKTCTNCSDQEYESTTRTINESQANEVLLRNTEYLQVSGYYANQSRDARLTRYEVWKEWEKRRQQSLSMDHLILTVKHSNPSLRTERFGKPTSDSSGYPILAFRIFKYVRLRR